MSICFTWKEIRHVYDTFKYSFCNSLIWNCCHSKHYVCGDVGVLCKLYCIECEIIGCNLKQTDFIAATLQQDRMGGKFVPGWQWRCSVVWFFIVVFTTDTRFSKSLANWSWKEGYPDRQTQRATCKVAITWVWGWQLLSWPFRRDAFKQKIAQKVTLEHSHMPPSPHT